MYVIKEKPEDFVVSEISSVVFKESGNFTIFKLRKMDIDTERAVQILCQRLRVPRKNIGYAGLKDKKAVTSQFISVFKGKKSIETLEFDKFSLKFVGFSDKEIALGDLKENVFEIVVRNLKEEDLEWFQKNEKKMEINNFFMPNFFGEQRFSKNNHEIGKLLVKKDFKGAVGLILNSGFKNNYEEKLSEFIKNNPNNYVGALRLIPKKILSIFINAYQSRIFNKVLGLLSLKSVDSNLEIPLVGYGTDLEKADQNLRNILEKERIVPRDFVFNQIPELSSFGALRKAFMKIDNFGAIVEEDELNKGRSKITLTFSLPRGSYATVVVKNLFTA